ncbi:radical SAM protein [Lentisalinibacter salinarum]|uniref:radical SAM protein n=1 Tax=Lentisalinibacter salinarum TaxID=2992239 RepID=UPI00386F42D4
MSTEKLQGSPALKTGVMFEGIRYTDALGAAAEHSLPNYYPYRFKQGERDPTGAGKANIPYLINTADDTLIRVLGNGDSNWSVSGDRDSGYRLVHDERPDEAIEISFEPLHDWMQAETSDGFPIARAGVSTHGDMMVINVAPGCEYFLHKADGKSMRCTFCSYGAPDQRTAHLGQVAGQVEIPDLTLLRMREAMAAVMAENTIRHIYLVGGSLSDPAQEGERFLKLARAAQAANPDNIPVTLGSGALPDEILRQFHEEGLVDAVCFNLEVWSEDLFSRVCPGKHRYVGYGRWIESLEQAVSLWGRGRVYSAMVAGIELEPEFDMEWREAADLAVRGVEDLCSRGIIPIYSLYYPVGGKDRSDYQSRLRNYFEHLVLNYRDIRRRHGLSVWQGFMCHRCAYMQLECDLDRQEAR